MNERTAYRPSRPAGRTASVSSRKPKAHRRRPGRPVEGRGEALHDAEQHRRDHRSRQAAQPPSTQIANTRPIYSRPTDGSTGWMMISSAPAIDAVAIEMPKAMRLMRDRIGRHQRQRQLILRHRHDRAADEGARQEELQRGEHQHRECERHQHAQREIDDPEMQRRPDIGAPARSGSRRRTRGSATLR